MADEKSGSDSINQNLSEVSQELKAWIFDIQRYSINDGPGIRTTVFFKGCPLRCLWCDNPESQSRLPQLFYFESSCARCQRCISVCPNEAISAGPDDSIITDRSKCKACGACTVVCPKDARVITGKLMTVNAVLDIIRQDTPFYRNSGGGMTASGGEAAAQPDFRIELFKKCRENGIHTTLDTTGYVKRETMQQILEYTDLVMLDIKHIDPAKHKEMTGVSNELILENARQIAETGKPMWIRFPLIPGCTDSNGNIDATADFTLSLGLKRIDILPYHRMGVGKYERLGMEYLLSEIKPYSEEQLAKMRSRLENKGLEVRLA